MPEYRKIIDEIVSECWAGEVSWTIDWRQIERDLGHQLPGDYKELCDRLPPGRFLEHFWLPHPMRSGADGRLDGWRALIDEGRRSMHAHLVEPRHVFPCLVTAYGGVGLYATSTSEPDDDDWTVQIKGGVENHDWDDSDLPLAVLLEQILGGDYYSTEFPEEILQREPTFVPDA